MSFDKKPLPSGSVKLKTIRKGWTTEGDKLLEYLVCLLQTFHNSQSRLWGSPRRKASLMLWKNSIFGASSLRSTWSVSYQYKYTGIELIYSFSCRRMTRIQKSSQCCPFSDLHMLMMWLRSVIETYTFNFSVSVKITLMVEILMFSAPISIIRYQEQPPKFRL
jgi:hypothetical protein